MTKKRGGGGQLKWNRIPTVPCFVDRADKDKRPGYQHMHIPIFPRPRSPAEFTKPHYIGYSQKIYRSGCRNSIAIFGDNR